MKTIKNFREYCGESLAALVNPVKNQLGANVGEFWQELENVNRSSCGAAAGFGGFIYYSETVRFWRKYRKQITAFMNYESESLGENVLSMVSKFKSLEDYTQDEIGRALYGRYDDDLTQIYNTFAWYALESVAFAYDNWSYELKH